MKSVDRDGDCLRVHLSMDELAAAQCAPRSGGQYRALTRRWSANSGAVGASSMPTILGTGVEELGYPVTSEQLPRLGGPPMQARYPRESFKAFS
jgi:hypothetical protein